MYLNNASQNTVRVCGGCRQLGKSADNKRDVYNLYMYMCPYCGLWRFCHLHLATVARVLF